MINQSISSKKRFKKKSHVKHLDIVRIDVNSDFILNKILKLDVKGL